MQNFLPIDSKGLFFTAASGQGVDAQVRQLSKAGCKMVFREVASGAKTDRSQLCKALD